MAFSWTNLPVDTNTKVLIDQLNEIYTHINTARSENGLSGTVSSGKSSPNDLVTAEDINKVRAEIDIISDNYDATGCTTHYTAYLRTNNLNVDFTVNTSVDSADCITVDVSRFITNYSSKDASYNSTEYGIH